MFRKKSFAWSSIDSVIFDLDRTLFATHLYFKYHMIRLGKDILKELYPKLPTRKIKQGAKVIYDDALAAYRRTLEPIGLYEMLRTSTITLYGIDIGENEKICKYISKEEEIFYTTSPQLYPHSLRVLNMFLKMEKDIAMHSHAQNIWTQAKVEHIQEKYKKKYGKDIPLMYYSTSLEDKKDSDAWSNSLLQFNFKPQRTLVIGDNLNDDIYASKDANIRYLIWLSHNKEIPSDIDKEIIVVKSIKDLLKL